MTYNNFVMQQGTGEGECVRFGSEQEKHTSMLPTCDLNCLTTIAEALPCNSPKKQNPCVIPPTPESREAQFGFWH